VIIALMAMPVKNHILSFNIFPPGRLLRMGRCYVQLVAADTGFR
jgi:hypothetical protein